MPERDDVVVCRITKLYPNSAEAELLEYGKPGMIHVSEVASRWVRDIREFLKEEQYVVCRVMGSDSHGITLSIKRVRREDANRKLNEFKREHKSENLLEQIAKALKKSKEQAFTEVGFLLQEEFGSLTKAFEMAARKPELLKQKGIPAVWEKAIIEAAQKKLTEKTYTLKGDLQLSTFAPDGITTLKAILLDAQKKGFQVAYITAPRYQLAGTGKDVKKLRASLLETGEAMVKAMKKAGGEGAFTLKD